MVGQTLKFRDGNNLDQLVSRDINDDLMVIIKVVEQDPDLGVENFYPSIDDDSKATYIDKEENNYENASKTPYDGENMNTSSDDEVNNDNDAPKNPYDGEDINAYSNNKGNNDEVALDPPTNEY